VSRLLRISVGSSRLSTRLTRKKVSWGKLAARLQKFHLHDIAYDDYLSLSREEQSQLKDVSAAPSSPLTSTT
jgi:hypothetical protein